MRLAIKLLAIRVKNTPEKLFSNDVGVYMEENSYNVSVNGATLNCNSDEEQVAAYISAFIVFQLKHTRGLDATLEVLESKIGIRRKCEDRKAVVVNNLI